MGGVPLQGKWRIDEKSAVLVESNGKAAVVCTGKGAYFLKPTPAPDVCEKGTPLTFLGITAYRVTAGGHFDLSEWKGDGDKAYSLSVQAGKIESRQRKQAVY